MKVLLIYEQIPEQTDFYVIDEPGPELMTILEACNGKVINSDDMLPDMQTLSDALSRDPEHCKDRDHPLACSITDKHEIPPPVAFDRVFSFGMMI